MYTLFYNFPKRIPLTSEWLKDKNLLDFTFSRLATLLQRLPCHDTFSSELGHETHTQDGISRGAVSPRTIRWASGTLHVGAQ